MLNELLDTECTCEFDLPTHEWPTPGYPAVVTVVDVDMPLVKLRSTGYELEYWINAKFIKKIEEVHQRQI